MLPSSLAVLMKLLFSALHSLDVAAISSSLSWLPAVLCTVVVADWHAALRFLGFLCSTSLTCRARAGGAAGVVQAWVGQKVTYLTLPYS